MFGSPVLDAAFAGVLGLLVGSFLNVVIYRLPQMLERQWAAECAELSGKEPEQAEPFNLVRPRSRCRQCGHAIRWYENIPVASYLALRGKCRACAKPISWRYPSIELANALLSLAVAAHFGATIATGGALLLTWSLVALTAIDYDTQLLPDDITLPLLWLGLLFNTQDVYVGLYAAVIGAVAGYVSLWLVFHLFKIITGREGMGGGDVKLLAMVGAFLGWQGVLLTLLLASLVGSAIDERQTMTPVVGCRTESMASANLSLLDVRLRRSAALARPF